jgi:prepilin-type N-terminal cleavage/methylation domain-containing protein
MGGFTLIELSIVLVIIGLITGGVLVGRDLISAAELRAQITQIEKYQTAVNTFRGKYGYLPGDLPSSVASSYGFFPRTGASGDGDGDGTILTLSFLEFVGQENVLFWTDLSAAGLIDGSFQDNSDTMVTANTDAQFAAVLPRAKLGNGNFIFVNSYYQDAATFIQRQGGYEIISLSSIGSVFAGLTATKPSVTPIQAQYLDQKVDDGFPLSGRVMAMMPDTTSFTAPANIIIPNVYPPSNCRILGSPSTYNTGTSGVSTLNHCNLWFAATW